MKHLQCPPTLMLLRSINPRVEKHGEEDVVRADLDFEFTASVEHISAIGMMSAKRWHDLIYQDTDKDKPARFREHQISVLRFDRAFEHHGLDLYGPTGEKILSLNDVKLSKFAVLFDEDQQTLRMRFQAAIDPDTKLDQIVTHLAQTVMVAILEPPQTDMFETPKPKPDSARVTPIKKGGRAFPDAMDGAPTH